MKQSLSLSVLAALLLAGCAQPAILAPADATTPPPANGTAAPSLTLYLQADLTLGPDPPAEEASVAPAIVANGPWVDDDEYPTWKTQLAGAAPNGTANVTFFVTSSSASFAATFLPVFVDLPQFEVVIGDGTSDAHAPVAGPAILRAGEVAQIRVEVPLDGLALAEGAALWLRIQPYYSQVMVVEEVRFLVGPEHPARVEIG